MYMLTGLQEAEADNSGDSVLGHVDGQHGRFEVMQVNYIHTYIHTYLLIHTYLHTNIYTSHTYIVFFYHYIHIYTKVRI